MVIVNFNTKELLCKCISSIKEKFVDVYYEVIVVDNDSKDGSIEMVEREFSDVILVKNKYNTGISKGNNQGVKIAKGKYILLSNSDIEVIDKNIKNLIEYMDKNREVGALGPKIYLPNGNVQTSATIFQNLFTVFARHLKLKKLLPSSGSRKFIIKKLKGFLGNTLRCYLRVYEERDEPEVVDWLASAFIFIRKKVFNQVGYWDEDFFLYGDEEDFQLRASKLGWQAVYYPQFKVIHHVGASGKGNPLVLTERYRSSLIFWHKHHSSWKVFVVRVIMFTSFGIRFIFCRDRRFREAYWQIFKYTVHNIRYIKQNRVLGTRRSYSSEYSAL